MNQMDVKTAFLNSKLHDEIFMEIPDGMPYTNEEKQKYVLKLEKLLYGLKTNPKRWYETFSEKLISLGFKPDKTDPCLFVYFENGVLIIIVLYVDDIIMTGNSESKLNEVKRKLQAEFKIKDLGEPKEYLGISIERDEGKRELKLHQT